MRSKRQPLLLKKPGKLVYQLQTRKPALPPELSLQSILAEIWPWVVLLIVSLVFYYHAEFRPILPIHLSPEDNELLKLFAFIGVGLSLIWPARLLLLLEYESIRVYVRRVFHDPARVVCATCGAKTPLRRYMTVYSDAVLVHGCKKCGSYRVYCARCGKSAHVSDFLVGQGCPHCGAPGFMVEGA